jgi:hypothetical protein
MLAIRGLASASLSGLVMSVAMICWIEGLRHTDNIGVGAFICSPGNIGAPLLGRVLFTSELTGGAGSEGLSAAPLANARKPCTAFDRESKRTGAGGRRLRR